MARPRITVSVDSDIRDFVEKAALRDGITRNAVVERALRVFRKNLCSWCKGTGCLGRGEVNPKQTTMPDHEGPITMTVTCYRCGGTGFRQDDGRSA